MKTTKYLIIFALCAVCAFALFSCKDTETPPEAVYYTVTFDSVGGSAVPSQKVLENGYAISPTEPEREGYIFSHWENGGNEWNFESRKISADVTLKAVWVDSASVFDYAMLEGDTVCITNLKRHFDVIKIPETINGYTVTAIGSNVFSSVTSDTVSRIVVADTVVSVAENAFKGCSEIKIELGGALTSVGENAFFGCDGLEKVTLGKGITTIPYAAFTGCTSLKSIVIPEGATTISENAFEECSSMTHVVLPVSLSSVESSAFRDCDALVAIYYYGTEADFDEISIVKNYNDALLEARLCVYTEAQPETSGDFWHYDERGNIKLWK